MESLGTVKIFLGWYDVPKSRSLAFGLPHIHRFWGFDVSPPVLVHTT